MQKLPPLWGGVLEDLAFDVVRQVISMQIRVVNSQEMPPVRQHSLVFSGVSDFQWHSTIPGPWDYAEVTEIHGSILATGEVLTEIMLWSEDAGISIKAASVLLDGLKFVTELPAE